MPKATLKIDGRRLLRAAALAAALLACFGPAAFGDMVWHQDAGWVNTRQAPEPGPEGAFRYAVGLLMQGHVESALEKLQGIDRAGLDPGLVRKIRFHEAKALLRRRSFADADAVRQRLWQEDLPGDWRDRVLALHLAIGREWAAADPRTGKDALRALRTLVADDPLLPKVIVELADAEVAAGLYDEARENYLLVVEDPEPGVAGRAVYGAGWADLVFCREVEFQPRRIRRALARFEEYGERFPGGPLANWAEEAAYLCQSLRIEYSEGRRRVFFAATHLLGGDASKAYRPLRGAARKYRDTYVGEAASFYVAEYRFQRERYWSAFKSYEALMNRYPGTMRVRKVVQRQFEIGRRLMEQEPAGLVWRSLLLSRAIRALDKSIDHNPSGPHAEEAQLYVGDCYMELQKWDAAYEAYMALIEHYPASRWVSTARFRSGLARFREAEFTEDKTDLLLQAERAFVVFLRENPEGPFAAEARELLTRIETRKAALQWRSARFYERTNQAAAAAFVLKRLVEEHPGTPWAEAARNRLALYAQRGLLE